MKKNIIYLIVAIAAGCNTESSDTNIGYTFDRTVGDEIPTELAERWLSDNAKADGRNAQPYSVTPETYGQALQTPGQAGLALQYAIDDNDELHVLLIPVGDKEVLFEQPSKIVDANTNTVIPNAQAKSWSEKFNQNHPGQTWYHFFGIDILQEINDKPFTHMDIKPAFDDEGKAQLLLYVWHGSALGRIAEAQDATVYDKSNQCPCPR